MKILKFTRCKFIVLSLLALQVQADDELTSCKNQCSSEYQQCVMDAKNMSPSGTRSIHGRECAVNAQACEDSCETTAAKRSSQASGSCPPGPDIEYCRQRAQGGGGGNGPTEVNGGRRYPATPPKG